MTKTATIASLVRNAARSEEDFVSTLTEVLEERDAARIAEFFDRLNIPRSVGIPNFTAPIASITTTNDSVLDFVGERAISDGIQKYLDRHERKVKWHATHPSLEGAENVLLIVRTVMLVTEVRLDRLLALLKTKDELNAVEWAVAREMMNRSYLSFRNFLELLAGAWVDAMLGAVAREDLLAKIGNFYEIVDDRLRRLEEYRQKIEDRRMQLTVLPEGFPPVKPPNYFYGDLLGRGPWKQFWTSIDNRAHHFREAVN